MTRGRHARKKMSDIETIGRGPSFRTSKKDLEIISRIARRVYADDLNPYETVQDCIMDLCAAKAQGCPIDFELLETWSKDPEHAFNFWHDIGGIARHLNRKTGIVENHFLPRSAR